MGLGPEVSSLSLEKIVQMLRRGLLVTPISMESWHLLRCTLARALIIIRLQR